MDDDEIVGVPLDRRRIDVALAKVHVAQAALSDARAGDGEHRRALVNADGAIGERRDSSSMRPVPVPRSSSAWIGLPPIIARIAASTLSPAHAARGCGPSRRRVRRNRRRPACAAPRASLPAARGRTAASDRPAIDPGDQIARQRAAVIGEAEKRPGALALALGSPASTSSLRWRETRGCDCPRIATSSLTVSSASQSKPRSRSRVTSPAASRASSRASKLSGSAAAKERSD